MSTPRLLVFTPTYEGLLRPETVESVKAQQFDGSLTHEIRDDNPYPGRDMRNVLAQYQWARDVTLDGDYDGLMTVEHDMRIPAHAAQTLWETKATVVYGLYVLRHGMSALSAWRYEHAGAMGMSLSLYPKELAQARKAGTWRVSGVGFGCTLIKREALRTIPFRGVDSGGVDMPFAVDCLHKGIVALARMDVACDHYHEGRWLTVTDSEPTARVLAVMDVVAGTDNGPIAMRKGKHYSVPVHNAEDLRRAGYVVITDTEGRETATDEKAETRETATRPAAKRRTRRKQ